LEQGGSRAASSRRFPMRVQPGRATVLSCQSLLHRPQPAGSLFGEGLAPALQGPQGRHPRFGAACFDLRPGAFALKPGAQTCLDALHQIVPPGQQEARQTTASVPTRLALPALHPDRVHPLLILWLAVIVPMPDQAASHLTLEALLRPRTALRFPSVTICLRIRSKIGYNDGGWSGPGHCCLGVAWAGRPFSVALKLLSYRIIRTRKAALFGAAGCLLTLRSSIYSRP